MNRRESGDAWLTSRESGWGRHQPRSQPNQSRKRQWVHHAPHTKRKKLSACWVLYEQEDNGGHRGQNCGGKLPIASRKNRVSKTMLAMGLKEKKIGGKKKNANFNFKGIRGCGLEKKGRHNKRQKVEQNEIVQGWKAYGKSKKKRKEGEKDQMGSKGARQSLTEENTEEVKGKGGDTKK